MNEFHLFIFGLNANIDYSQSCLSVRSITIAVKSEYHIALNTNI